MNRLLKTLLTIGIFLITASHLPAPIQEIPESPTPAPKYSPEPKATRSRVVAPDTTSDSLRKFEGTWIRRDSETNAKGTRNDVIATLAILKGRSADLTEEFISTLAPGVTWSNLPEPYDTISPLRDKWKRHSSELRVSGSNLTIRWSGDQLIDWAPKTIPREHFATMKRQTPGFITYALMGDQLTSNNGKIYRRAR
jgi:hypothetical protein